MNAKRLKIRLNRFGRRILAAPWLHPVRPLPPARRPGEVWLFVVVRNEVLRLSAFLRHHFDLGISRVILVNNDSADYNLSLAGADSHVHVFPTAQAFAVNKMTCVLRGILTDIVCEGLCLDAALEQTQMNCPRSDETVLFGPGSIKQGHATVEYIASAELKAASDTLARLLAAG